MVIVRSLVNVPPTAQASLAEIMVTLCSSLSPGAAGLGVVTGLHVEPFQRSARVRSAPLTTPNPTANALLAELASTPSSTLAPFAGSGLADRVQVVPFQRS